MFMLIFKFDIREQYAIIVCVACLQIESIGSFFMKLLKESKHRGAFELAYAGFIKLTTRLWRYVQLGAQ